MDIICSKKWKNCEIQGTDNVQQKNTKNEIKSTQPGSQIYVSIDRFLLAIIMLK